MSGEQRDTVVPYCTEEGPMLGRLLLVLLFTPFALVGCSSGDAAKDVGTSEATREEAGSSLPERTIGYSSMTFTNPFFKVIADSMEDEGRKYNFKFVVVSGDQNSKKQSDQVDDFITKGVDAIVLNPCDSKSIGTAIKKANEAGIPVFTNDLAYDGDDAEVVNHVATDNFQGGKLAGEAMIKLLGEAGGKVAVLHYMQAESCQLRDKGFTEVIEAHNKKDGVGKIDIAIVSESNADRSQGQKAAQDALQSHPDLAAMFAINDPAALGAYAAVKAADKLEQVRIIGFDGQLDGKQAILEGKIVCDPIQFPDQIGRKTVQMIAQHFDGEQVPREFLIPSALYYQEDAKKDPALSKSR